MDKTVTEVFGEFTYSQSLSYYDLLSHEELLMEKIDKIFLQAGAEYMDFTPSGDILKLQCGFENHDLDLFRDIAREIAAILPDRVRGRLFCLEKNLASCHMFWLKKEQWQEEDKLLPTQPPEGAAIHKSR